MTVLDYINNVPSERRLAFSSLRQAILDNLPPGFSEEINYGMIGYVVPHSLYPAGYHCNPKDPLPFMALASQKHSINFYHMGLYQNAKLSEWFVNEYVKTAKHKIDMGKSCVRFKYFDEIPFALIGELAAKIDAAEWIRIYEKELKGRGA